MQIEEAYYIFSEETIMLNKWNANAPYYMFFNTLAESPETAEQINSVQFTDLLCPSLGKVKCSLQLTSVADIYWLMDQYKEKNLEKTPLTVIYSNLKDYNETTFIDENYKEVTYHEMKVEGGSHHSKIGIYVYDDDSLRIVISTANLYKEEWNNFNHALWISPRCPAISDAKNDGESKTGFRSDLLNYLKAYNVQCLEPWINIVENVDFSAIRIFLVTSIPGLQQFGKSNHSTVVANLLNKYCQIPDENGIADEKAWKIIGQSSNIGGLGPCYRSWLCSLVGCLSAHKGRLELESPTASFCFIYPTYHNVTQGYSESGDNLNKYKEIIHKKQKWFEKSLYQWKADRLYRSRAMPHLKGYTRISPSLDNLAFYLLTSANLSRGAWGYRLKNGLISVRSFEVGVLFLPEFFDEDYFEINHFSNNANKTLFPLMYDLPLVKYNSLDDPWTNT